MIWISLGLAPLSYPKYSQDPKHQWVKYKFHLYDTYTSTIINDILWCRAIFLCDETKFDRQTTFPFRINMYTRLLISRLFSNVHDLIRVYTFIRFWLLNLNSLYIFFVVYSIFHICLSKRIEINMSCQHFYSLTAYFCP